MVDWGAEEGKTKYIGLSEANIDTIRKAHSITAVQMEWSLWTRKNFAGNIIVLSLN